MQITLHQRERLFWYCMLTEMLFLSLTIEEMTEDNICVIHYHENICFQTAERHRDTEGFLWPMLSSAEGLNLLLLVWKLQLINVTHLQVVLFCANFTVQTSYLELKIIINLCDVHFVSIVTGCCSCLQTALRKNFLKSKCHGIKLFSDGNLKNLQIYFGLSPTYT